MAWAAGLSLLLHMAALVAILWQPARPAPAAPVPLNQATVQILLTKGQGDQRARGGPTAPPAPPKRQQAAARPPVPRSTPPQPKTDAPPAPRPKAAAAPPRQSLPMEFGSLGGPSVAVRNDRNKSVNVTTQPDKGNLAPAYPPAAARRHQMGTVGLWLYVAADGFVDRVKVIKSSGYPLLDQAAVARLRTWHFTPATQGGAPVSSIYKIAVTFGP